MKSRFTIENLDSRRPYVLLRRSAKLKGPPGGCMKCSRLLIKLIGRQLIGDICVSLVQCSAVQCSAMIALSLAQLLQHGDHP